MKKILIIMLFLFIPVVTIFSQNKNDTNPVANQQQQKHTYAEVICKDCQGWGWLVSVNLHTETASTAISGNSSARIKNSAYTLEVSQGRAICPYCKGKGKIMVKLT